MGFFKKTQERVRKFKRGYEQRKTERLQKQRDKWKTERERLEERRKLEETKTRIARAKYQRKRYGGQSLGERIVQKVTEPKSEKGQRREFYDPFERSLFGPSSASKKKKPGEDLFEDKGLI